jgi:lysophospholipase L1-like esterase
MMRKYSPAVAVSLVLAATFSLPAAGAAQRAASGRWLTAWGTSQQTVATAALTNTTVRLIARVTIGGDALRLRFDNTYGKTAIRIGHASVGLRARGPVLVAGSTRAVLFAGSETTSIPAGGSVRSDPIAMNVLAMQDLAVSVYLPDSDVLASQHSGAMTTSYVGTGDHASAEAGDPFRATITTMPLLKSIDVRSTSAPGAIVAFGDSITDGTCSTVDGHDRWVDWLTARLALEAGRRGGNGTYKAVVNEGIGGNTVTRDGLQPPPDSTPGLERLERDVLSHDGVTDVIVFMGTNDIRRGASAVQVMDGLAQIAKRIKAQKKRVFGVTIIPRHNVPAAGTNTGWNDAKTAIRREVNQWIRTRAPFDGVLDFDAAVRDPANADLIQDPFNCDGIHPTPRGYFEIGRVLPLELLTR